MRRDFGSWAADLASRVYDSARYQVCLHPGLLLVYSRCCVTIPGSGRVMTTLPRHLDIVQRALLSRHPHTSGSPSPCKHTEDSPPRNLAVVGTTTWPAFSHLHSARVCCAATHSLHTTNLALPHFSSARPPQQFLPHDARKILAVPHACRIPIFTYKVRTRRTLLNRRRRS